MATRPKKTAQPVSPPVRRELTAAALILLSWLIEAHGKSIPQLDKQSQSRQDNELSK
ncbi:MAG TPA: hypothetical protein VKP04_07175 [Ktedonobacteraceae bacterium]|nr:hypothetical protein [Ktedonobacteraceae bacterium]